MDVKKKIFSNKYEVFSKNGTKASGIDAVEYAVKLEQEGAGELLINSIELDGTMKGYDLNLIKIIRAAVNIPITILGGASSFEEMSKVVNEFGVIGLAAGSLFVFKGRFRAVLISYPTPIEKRSLLENSLK